MQRPLVQNIDQYFEQIRITIIITELRFFNVQIQRAAVQTSKLDEPRFQHSPEKIYLIDLRTSTVTIGHSIIDAKKTDAVEVGNAAVQLQMVSPDQLGIGHYLSFEPVI